MAMMTASAVLGGSDSEYSVQYLNGREERSTLATVSVMMVVPNLSDCFRMASLVSSA